MITETISGIVNFLVNSVGSLGYLGIFILMAVESSVFPLPSEIVLIPAGVLVAQSEMNFFAVIIVSILGGLFGALISYYIALFFGRKYSEKLINKYGKIVFVTKEHFETTDSFFKKYGSLSIFMSRLLPVVRHLISLPAGFSKMDIYKFSFYTSLGAGLWALILVSFGYWFGNNMDIINKNLNLITFIIILICIFVVVGYLVIRNKNKSL